MAAAAALMVELHNECRRRHGVPPLQLDLELCDLAERYATALASGEKRDEPDSNIGRNIFKIQTATSSKRNRIKVEDTEAVRDAMTTWYNHISDYNWDHPLSSEQHARLFAQVVWKASRYVGVSVVFRGIVIVVVALYSPLGNIVDEERCRENVLRPLH